MVCSLFHSTKTVQTASISGFLFMSALPLLLVAVLWPRYVIVTLAMKALAVTNVPDMWKIGKATVGLRPRPAALVANNG